MDARTFNKENEIPNQIHINFIAMMLHNLNGNIIFDTVQKWYYYSMQTTKEVLVFHQYTKVGLERTSHPKTYTFRVSSMRIPTLHLRTGTVPRIQRAEYL